MISQAAGFYAQLKRSQWWPLERLRDLQWRRIHELIVHSYENVPFYREKFDQAGIKPGDIRSFDDLPLIQPSTKSELREAFSETWLAKGYSASDCKEAVTSGSTGAPLKFLMDKRSLAFRFALNMRTLEMSDYRLGQKLFQVSPPLSGKLGAGFSTKAIDAVLRRVTIPPFETDMENKVARLIEFRPQAIVGYGSYIKTLAELVREKGAEVRIKSIMTTSEALLDDTREELERVFGGRVFDQYGSVETGRTAAQCTAQGGYHMNLEGALIEVIDENGGHAAPGALGEVIVTNLMNYAMPFLRYRQEDMAALSQPGRCECGRELPMLERISGRLNDVIVTAGGRRIMPEYFYLTIREITGLNQFQVAQVSADKLKVLFTPGPDFDESKLAEVKKEYDRYFTDMEVAWERVDRIDKISGKHRHIMALRK